MRVGIFFDTFLQGGGAEKIIEMLAEELNADIITSGFNENLYSDGMKKKVKSIGNSFYGINNRVGFVETAFRFYFNRKNFDYDFYIFGGIFSIFAAKGNKPNCWFCFSPNRTLYDLKEKRIGESGAIGKAILRAYINFLKPIDQKIVRRDLERIITISKNSSGRVKKFYGLDSKIIYPPIETQKYKFREFGDYYFTANRLVPEKRVDLIARAFAKMPNKKLIIAGYGGEEKKIKKIIERCRNIEFVGRISEKQLIEYYSNCLATIYMPHDEDFGMVPLEGNASGKPCIAVNEGGCKETVIQGKTGFLVEPREVEIIKAVKGLNAKKAEEMKNACINWAKRFDDLGPEVGQEAKGTSESSLIVRINKSIEKFICKKYEKIISYSYGITEKIMKRDSVGREKIVTIFMTPRKIRKKRERDVGKKSQKKPFLIVYTGSLQNYEFVLKGFKKLFFSLKKIKEKKIDFALHVAGEGKARRALIEMGRILGLEENVFFRGELSRKGIDSLLRQADAAIVPLPHSSHMQQTFPTRVLEYLSLGKAIIAPDYGEFARCFKHKENAILYNERSEEDLTEKILELMKEKKLKQRIEKNALWLFETQFNQKEMEERLRRIYFEN